MNNRGNHIKNYGGVIFLNRCINVFLLLTFMLVLTGCNHSEDNLKDDEVMRNIDIYDFHNIKKAPVASMKQDLDEIIKLTFSTNSPIQTRIAIDIKNNKIYKNPIFSKNGLVSTDGSIEFDYKEKLLNILEKYKIQDWKKDYTTEDPDTYQDGAGWYLLLQFEDGTTESHGGQGTTDKIFPKEFDAFVEEIDQLAKEILGEDYMKNSQSEP